MEKVSVGRIAFMMADRANDRFIELGGGVFYEMDGLARAWDKIEEFEGHTDFIADLVDADGGIISDKAIDYGIITACMGKEIDYLINQARKHADSPYVELSK